ncbi:hypothetical protein QAD02_022564 [Eretmocerus hayati]|uniref:Uncharacterized protein n=1 Tax=Eretmocerus hayati TaxID=131215 RepID=A0ACC2PT46_9HYME|nr:hypothetical protein QAD02_022564 [Eretmocerus hayati]
MLSKSKTLNAQVDPEVWISSRQSALILLVLISISSRWHQGVTGQCLSGNDNPSHMQPEAAEKLVNARFDFAIEALRRAAQLEPNDNIFFSPHSLYEALGLAYFGSRGDTEASLKQALRVPNELSKVDVQRVYAFEKSVANERKINASSSYDYTVANRLWLSKDKKLRGCMFDFFGDELERVSFKNDPNAVRQQINQWVSNETRGNIKDLLPQNSIDESTDAVLANAVYFKGLWQSKFLRENTKKDLFHVAPNNLTMVQFMKQKGTFNHLVSEELGVHIVQLPYKGEEVSMFILLPPYVQQQKTEQPKQQARSAGPDQQQQQQQQQQQTERLDGVDNLLRRLSDTREGASELREALDENLASREVVLSLPKFSLERELPVKHLLDAMGASTVLDPSSDFGGFVEDGEKPIHLGDAVHRAKIEVTEDGTTAAAATALFSFRSSRPSEPEIFNANHPFAYFIYDKPTRTVLFAGVYRKPNKS